ncbi:hypothetical protein COV81_05200 [Candidatus Peregrinibacteria bacterium CG11_big_fil_rev_8_21_14_0_20_41_10]|nr:MAG: hypothetical protein COV81_05200 [Candidatus Peregrinibacteria bacterium CG11_big_fil_rev_8_21_14_0_20_41_10]PIZ74662.1 MAG: hypothetical protein COY06_03795 [Candidatus Peregrinibacteria bacterium CG_4_10_14_0_2_um_filter_41_8]PJC38307.1 MAG: hypothetical protein CO045_00875 [Candidatus Peregrinibacteria bacterium CG_4_9_14_0_2_um_filter_41_14]
MKKILSILIVSVLAIFLFGCAGKPTAEVSVPAFATNLPTEWLQTVETGLEKDEANASTWKELSRMSAGEDLYIKYGMLTDSTMTLRDFSKKTFEGYLPQVAATDDVGFEEDLSGGRSYFVTFVQNVVNDGYYMEVFTLPTPDSTTFVSVSATGATKEEAMSNAFKVYQVVYPGDDLTPFVQ